MTNEEAVKVLKLERASWSANPNLKVVKCLCDAYDIALKALEQTRWIPVSERLPEKNGRYLVTMSSFCCLPQRIEVLSFAMDLHRIDKYDFPEHKCGFYYMGEEWGYLEVDDVLAWMPLPEEYKEVSEE